MTDTTYINVYGTLILFAICFKAKVTIADEPDSLIY